MRTRFTALMLSIFILACIVGCALQARELPPLNKDMRDAYRSARALYGYVWSRELFNNPQYERSISENLDRLSSDFHKAELDAPIEAFEPGFRIALATQKSLLANASARFKEGKKEYVRWQLRGMAANCIGCHSRYQAPVNFVGDLPSAEDQNPETLLSQGEFLFATRQFDKASDLLFRTAEKSSRTTFGWENQFQALKLWLVIEVRTKNQPRQSAQKLKGYLKSAEIPSAYRSSIENWVKDLRLLDKNPTVAETPIEEAKRLLSPLTPESTISDQEKHLVTTLRASSLLHQLLQSGPVNEQKRQATYMLGEAYFHAPLSIFEPFVDQYLEIAIREFPHTREARAALQLYESHLQSGLGISGGELAPDQLMKLHELRKLAAEPEEPNLHGESDA